MHAVAGSLSVGIDIAETRKGLDLVALGHDQKIVESRGRLTIDEAVGVAMELKPAVVCIDSPSGWSTSGRSRLAERQLASLGIQSYRTGADPGDHPFYGWMRAGFEVFSRLAPTYPLYRGGGDVGGTAAEIFPHATACLLAGALRSPNTPKETFRRRVLREAGIADEPLRTIDAVDAALAAVTGLIALGGTHSMVGDPAEGVILVPVPNLPVESLSAERSQEHAPATPATISRARARAARENAPRRGRSLDVDRASQFIAEVPAGQWTSYKDVATVAGNERGAQAIGDWLRRRGHELRNVHRVLRSDGFVADAFRAAGPGVPGDARRARELLKREGVTFDDCGRASQTQRVQLGPQ
jgi:alkylated DNA nucleotide flippase Atl1/predicted nuclease with RNAse H fold